MKNKLDNELKNQIIDYISKIYWHYNRKFDYDDALITVKHNALKFWCFDIVNLL